MEATDRIMSNEKSTNRTVRKTPVMPAVAGKDRLAGERREPKEIEVVGLEIADDNFGGDPYNHTGTHCVLKIDDDG